MQEQVPTSQNVIPAIVLAQIGLHHESPDIDKVWSIQLLRTVSGELLYISRPPEYILPNYIFRSL